jgi:hypothetical protein
MTIRCLPKTRVAVSQRTGDDGAVLAGWPGARFVDNGDGTVTDYALNPPLVWVKQPELIIPGVEGEASGAIHATNQVQRAQGNWADSTAYLAADLVAHNSKFWVCIAAHTGPGDASTDPDTDAVHWRKTLWTGSAANLTTVATMIWAAATDNSLMHYSGVGPWSASNPLGWRLPNVLEFASLLTWSLVNPVDVTQFPNSISSGSYWTSTVRSSLPSTWAYYVYTSSAVQIYPQLMSAAAYVRPVRGGFVNG